MLSVGWRVRLLGSGEGEARTVFLCSCMLAARRGRLQEPPIIAASTAPDGRPATSHTASLRPYELTTALGQHPDEHIQTAKNARECHCLPGKSDLSARRTPPLFASPQLPFQNAPAARPTPPLPLPCSKSLRADRSARKRSVQPPRAGRATTRSDQMPPRQTPAPSASSAAARR